MAVNGAESEEEELMVILHACSVGRADVLSNAVSSLKSKYPIPQVADLVGALRSEEGEGVLHICAAKGYSDAIRLLLNLGLDPALRIQRRRAYEIANQAARKTFFSYLLEKIAMEDVSAVERLLLGGVEVIFEDESALCWACAFGSETTVGLLLAFTEDVNFREKTEGNTALHIACKHNYTSIAKLLLWKNTAALDVRNKNGELPINKVSENNEELKLLLQSPSSSSECNHEIVQAAALKMKELLERDVLNDAEENARVRAALQEAGFISNDNDDEEEEEEEEEEGKEESPSSSGTSAGGKDTTIHPSIDAAAPTVTISYVKKDLFLWPFPQRYEFTELEPLLLPISQPLVLCVLSKTVDILPLLRGSGFLDLFERLHMAIEVQRLSSAAKVRLAVDSNLCPGINRYLLSVTSTAISITASDTAGFMHGLQALTQYLQIYAEAFSLKSISYIKVPTIDISDWPDVLQRAVLWSFNETSLSSFSLLSSLVELLSKLRINRLLLLLRNDDMNGLSPQTSADIEVEESTTNIYALDEVCRRFFIELIPAVVIARPSEHLSCRVLQNFSNPILVLVFLFDESCKPDECIESCRHSMRLAQSAGVTSLHVACTPWMKANCSPLDIASQLGLRAVEQSLDSLCSFDLSLKSLSSIEAIIHNTRSYSDEVFARGSSFSVLPGLLDSFFVSPVALIKIYTFLHAGFTWNRWASRLYFDRFNDLSALKDVTKMLLFPQHFYSRDTTSDSYLMMEALLNQLTSSSAECEKSKPGLQIFRAENCLWLMLTSHSYVGECTVPPRQDITDCLRNYRRCLSTSRWKLGGILASRGQSSAAASSTSLASPESLDADEFFSLMHLLTILCKLILFGYNGIEKQHAKAVSVGIDGGSAAITFEKIVRALPIGSKSDLANSFLETLDHCMAIWRMRYDSISFHVQLGDKRLPPPPFLSYSPPANSTIGTHISHLLQGRLCFPAVEVLKAICRDVSIGNSVDGLLERIFGVRNLVM